MSNRVVVKEQSAKERIKNFDEVCIGYDKNEAVLEASRCLNCKNPMCVSGCPVSINIPAFINELKNENFSKAIEIINLSSSLPAICGRVCPQETQCEAKCVLGLKGEPVAIGKLERFTADYARNNNLINDTKIELNGYKVAIVGAGPAGLSCATDLAKMGYKVTIFEALHLAGGVLTYGIPEFRLPKEEVVKAEIDNVKRLGVNIETDVIVGKTITIESLMKDEKFDAVFIASGAGLPMFMNIKGENSNGVFSANEFLTRNNLMKAYLDNYDTPVKVGKKILVIGGGNVAMDAARTAVRLGAETHIVYRRSMNELPARKEEVEHAIEEGIIFDVLVNPIEIIADENENVKAVKLLKMELGEPDEKGRRRPIEIPNSEFEIDCDMVIMALGTTPNPLLPKNTNGLNTTKKGCIEYNEETTMTSIDGVFVGGDAAIGAATVILAMGAGKKSASEINKYIMNKNK